MRQGEPSAIAFELESRRALVLRAAEYAYACIKRDRGAGKVHIPDVRFCAGKEHDSTPRASDCHHLRGSRLCRSTGLNSLQTVAKTLGSTSSILGVEHREVVASHI